MTGFARVQGGDERQQWTWEVKSVNGRGLDLRFRLPPGWDGLEAAARQRLGTSFKRGSLQIALTLKAGPARLRPKINREMLGQVMLTLRDLQDELTANDLTVKPPRLDGLLALRGVVETQEEDEGDATAVQELEAALLADLDKVLIALTDNRLAEGRRLAALTVEQVSEIERLGAAARACAALQPEALSQRLRARLAELLAETPQLTEERLSQEVALLVSKVDVREELDRLAAHVHAAQDLLAAGGAVGRKLDFLCQEFNREANTLCSKSPDIALTRIGLDLKSAIDQLREQIQNIE